MQENSWSEESGIGWRIGPGMIQNSKLVCTWLTRLPWELLIPKCQRQTPRPPPLSSNLLILFFPIKHCQKHFSVFGEHVIKHICLYLLPVLLERPTALKQNYPTLLKDFFYLIFIKFRTNQNRLFQL
jgi:hypothetical protein